MTYSSETVELACDKGAYKILLELIEVCAGYVLTIFSVLNVGIDI